MFLKVQSVFALVPLHLHGLVYTHVVHLIKPCETDEMVQW